jgi:hypothetical protein
MMKLLIASFISIQAQADLLKTSESSVNFEPYKVAQYDSGSQSNTAQKKSKSGYNTNLYEAEPGDDNAKSFSAKVRVVRDISDDIDVFFESDKAKGAYSLPRHSKNFAAMLKALETSKKPNGPMVTVTVDTDKNITSVQLGAIPKEGERTFVVPSDPNKKWDFGKLPD